MCGLWVIPSFTANEDEHEVVTHLSDMCLSKSVTLKGIFQTVNGVLEKHEISWGELYCTWCRQYFSKFRQTQIFDC